MINLDNVTLFSVDCKFYEPTIRSIKECTKSFKFKEVVFLGDRKPTNITDDIKFIKIKSLKNLNEYSSFLAKELVEYINTEFCMSVHHDGWIINPNNWRKEFLEYDYIGAPWPKENCHFLPAGDKYRVGNGGVSIRSKRLMELVKQYAPDYEYHEDTLICHTLRDKLEEHGVVFAPLEIAKYFSYELECKDLNVTFDDVLAFHGSKHSEQHKQKYLLINTIEAKYNDRKNTPSDINEHLPTLYDYALKCNTIAEFGVRSVVSSYAFAHARPKELLCLDINNNINVDTFIDECKQEDINASFVHASSLDYELPHEYDLLFIDTLHTFNQLTLELEKHHSKITKYIIFHDTIFWGHKDEIYTNSGYASEQSNNVGLVPAIGNFLKKNKQWREVETYTNNNGLTIIERLV